MLAQRLTRLTLAAVIALLAACASPPPPAVVMPPVADTGMVSVKSPRSVADTVIRLEAELAQRKLAVLAKINHAAAAGQVGMSLRPTTVLIFGSPQVGTPLMQCAQAAGIDLPMKALVWEDAAGQVWLGYNDPIWVARRHGSTDCAAAGLVAQALGGIAVATVAP
jgi:uncharacterized protein (DUF302 family)